MCCWKQFANATLRKPITGTNMSQLLVHTPLTVLKGVGPAMAEKLAKVGLEDLQDLLFHLPSRDQDRPRLAPVAALRPGQDAVVAGRVMAANIVIGKSRSLLVRIQDGSGGLSLRFFHFSMAQKNALNKGVQVRCYGEVRPGATGPDIHHPEYRLRHGDQGPP